MLQAQNSVFVRIYNDSNYKIAQGFLLAANDTGITLWQNGAKAKLLLKEISSIRTKRAAGSNIGYGILLGGIGGAITGALMTDPNDFIFNTPVEGAGVGILVGIPSGAVLGLLTVALKNSDKFIIRGDAAKLNDFAGWAKQHRYIK